MFTSQCSLSKNQRDHLERGKTFLVGPKYRNELILQNTTSSINLQKKYLFLYLPQQGQQQFFAQPKWRDAGTPLNRARATYTPTKHISSCSYLAAAARRFFALGAPGSTERDLAANSSLLDAIEMFLRFPITCIWSSFVWRVKRRQSAGTDHSFPGSSQWTRNNSRGGGID